MRIFGGRREERECFSDATRFYSFFKKYSSSSFGWENPCSNQKDLWYWLSFELLQFPHISCKACIACISMFHDMLTFRIVPLIVNMCNCSTWQHLLWVQGLYCCWGIKENWVLLLLVLSSLVKKIAAETCTWLHGGERIMQKLTSCSTLLSRIYRIEANLLGFLDIILVPYSLNILPALCMIAVNYASCFYVS